MENAHDIQAAVESLTSMEAEQSVLGGILLDGLPAFARCDRLAAEMFYLAAHRLVYGVMAQMAADGLPLDVVTVGEALEARNLAAETGGMGYLVELAQITPSAANIVRYAAIVESRYTERRLLAASAEIERIALDKSGESAEDKCSAAAAVLGKVNDTLLHKAETCQSYAQALGGTLDYMAQKRKGLQGISTGLADLDAITQGLQKGNLVVIAARPGMGKTVLAENIARHAAKQGLRVHFQSYEMSQRELVMRGMAAEAEIHFGSLKRGELDIEEIRRKDWFVGRAPEWALTIDSEPAGIERLCLAARDRKLADGLDLLVIDHLHLMPRPGRNSEVQELGDITARLKRLAMELDIPVLLLAQLNRAVAKQTDKRPTMADIRGSGSIEQDANIIIMPHRPGYYDENENPHLAELIVAKNRDGEAGTVYAGWEGHYQRFTDQVPYWAPPPKEQPHNGGRSL